MQTNKGPEKKVLDGSFNFAVKGLVISFHILLVFLPWHVEHKCRRFCTLNRLKREINRNVTHVTLKFQRASATMSRPAMNFFFS